MYVLLRSGKNLKDDDASTVESGTGRLAIGKSCACQHPGPDGGGDARAADRQAE